MSRLPLLLILMLGVVLSGCGQDEGTVTPEANHQAAPGQAIDNNGSVTPQTTAQPKAISRQPTGPDIAGIYLGMTPDEAREKMTAYDADMQIQDSSLYFEYNALGKRYKTDSFLAATIGQMTGGRGGLSVGYSYPPKEPRVISITRIHRQTTAPLTQADYLKALIDKYGPPVEDSNNGRTGSRAERTLKWTLPGTGSTICTKSASVGNGVLDRFVKDGRKMADPTPEYAADCAGLFEYTLMGEPVTQANGVIFDVWALAKSEFESRDWVQQQVDEKSRTGTEPPKL